MKSKRMFFVIVGLLLAAALGLSGCTPPKPAGLADQQLADLTENALKALDANDYQKFTQDFSEQMNAAYTQQQFTDLRAMLQKASGNYVSLGTPTLANNQGYAVYRFPAKYASETVYVTVTFLVGGSKVEGLWFDSTNLRKAPK